jgi:hypothetical protein
MILDLSINADLNKMKVFLDKCISDGSKIDLKRVAKKRTLKQNRYVHVLFSLWGAEFGYSLDEAKQVVKERLGYTYVKNGITFYRKTSEMDTKEKTTFIDRFRNWSASEGFYLASAEEVGDNWEYFAREIERAEQIQKQYGY